MIRAVRVKNVAEGLDCIKSYLKKREERGKESIVFSEDRLTLLVERAICEELGGSMLTDVSTLSRYVKRTDKRVLSKQGSVIKIGEIILKNKDELLCFNKEYSAKTASGSVYETLAQFAACNITAEALENCVTEDRILNSKIHDLSVIYKDYVRFLQNEGFADENEMLSILPHAIREDGANRYRSMVFFAFGSFTAQAKEGLRAAMECAEEVLGVFIGGSEDFYTNEALNSFLETAEESGGAKLYSFPSAFDSERNKLAQSLFNADVYRSERVDTDRIKIYESQNEKREILLACSVINEHILSGKRFKDITLFVPKINDYYGEIKKSFDEYGIEFFADVKKPLSEHPLSKFILSVFKAADDGCAFSSVDDILSNVFFGECGEYRNYLSKFALYRGGAKAPIKSEDVLSSFGYDREYLEPLREKLLNILSYIPSKNSARGYCDGIKELLAFIDADSVLLSIEEKCKDVAMRGYLNQIQGVLSRLLDEIALISSGVFTAGEFYDLLHSGFSAASISLVPIKADAVFVGEIGSSKVDNSDIVIAIGLTSAVPDSGADVALVSDSDIAKLKNKNIDVAPLIAQVNMRSREAVALNLLSFNERLYMSYPISFTGNEVTKSEVVTYTERAFTNGGKSVINTAANLFPYDSATLVSAIKRTYEKRSDPALQREYSAGARLLEEFGVAAFVNEEWNGYDENSGKLFFKDENEYVSPTLIENFNACPYKNLFERGLNVRENQEDVMQYNDSGTFMHEILRAVGERIKNGELTSAAQCESAAEEVGREVLSRPSFKAMNDEKSNRYYAERLIADAKRIARALFEQFAGGGFKIDKTEKTCYSDSLKIKGQIDRIDVSDYKFRIIDYKTGKTGLNVTDYYMGLKVQLQLYACAINSLGENRAVGALYFPAKVEYSDLFKGEDGFSLSGFVSADYKSVDAIPPKAKEISGESFEDFLSYSVEITKKSKEKMKQGFVKPTPASENVCSYCPYMGACGYGGEGRRGGVMRMTVNDILRIMKGEEE